MNETWFQLRSRSFPRPVVVLDVSAAAAALWPVLHSTVEGLAEELPAAARPDVAFLGDSVRYPLDAFLKRADELIAVNRGRGRIISPLLESFGAHSPARVVVITTRPVIDLADWRSSPNAGRIAVIRTDPTVPIANGLYPETDLADVRAVAAVVHQPVAQIRLAVEGGLPVSWDIRSYRFENGELVADPSAGSWDVRAGFLVGKESATASARLIRADKTFDPLPVENAETPEEPQWLPFPPSELTALDAWRAGRSAHCRACGQDHTPGVVACSDEKGTILPSTVRLGTGFVRVRVKMFKADFASTARPTCLLSDGRVAVSTADEPELWAFDSDSNQWQKSDEPGRRFERLSEDDEYAIALPAARGAGR